ncbi:hypothetical protein EVAR_76590_1 [Eumeta japonica]|uniref:Uncharacterized protein n=1 Tax=Eumeta variegata TaxID=151549 RepID=A0A4C1T8I1_EUMVA|nr:hypothetical protein EVAR_76590_1 [Eumeta japonica]
MFTASRCHVRRKPTYRPNWLVTYARKVVARHQSVLVDSQVRITNHSGRDKRHVPPPARAPRGRGRGADPPADINPSDP